MKLNKKTKKMLISATCLILTVICAKSGIDLTKYNEEINSLIKIEQSEYDIKEQNTNNIEINNLEKCKVIRVVDGDTFVIEYKESEEKVRLIGIDTPESVHPDKQKNTDFGKYVSNYSKEKLTGKEVQIEFDVSQRDKYGRLLCYVYLDGQMYNKLLLQEGLAKVATYPPNVKYAEEFAKIQKEARKNKKGLWQDGFCVEE